MDANLTLLFMTVLTAGAIVLQLVRVRPPEVLSHLAAPSIVLAIAAVAYVAVPQRAGFIAVVAAILLIVVPLYSALPLSRALASQRYKRARWLARVAATLNPIGPRLRTLKTIELLEAVDEGRVNAAELDPRALSPHMRGAYIQALRSAGRYDEIIAYCRSAPAAERERDFGLIAHEVRALGETGRYEEMIELAKRIQHKPGAQQVNADVRMMTLAMLGQVELAHHFANARARVLGDEIARYWKATALAAAGDPSAAEGFVALTRSSHAGIRRAAQQRLDQPMAPVDVGAVLNARAYIDEIAAEVASAAGMDVVGRTVATRLLMAAITVMFVAQLPGGTTDMRNIVELGALVVPPVPGFDQRWRLLTAAFLHFGFAHFAMNMLGLWILGRRLEGALGSLRLGGVFLGAAILGNEAAVLFMKGPAVVVGASGGVLGLLGALVGVVLHRRRHRTTRYLDGVLREVAAIAITQVAFDMMMPNIGSTVHVGGFVAGVVLGFVLSPRQVAGVALTTSSR